MNDAVYHLFNSGKWDELNRSVSLTKKEQNPEPLIFQHIPGKENINKPYKSKRVEKIDRSRSGIVTDALNSVDIVEIVKARGVASEVYERFLCSNLQFIPYVDFVNDNVAKRELY